MTEQHRGHRCCLDPSRKGGGRFSLIGSRPSGRANADRVVVVSARCKSYGCPCCADRNIRRNQKRAALGMSEGGGLVVMLTATLDPDHALYQRALDATPVVDTRSVDVRLREPDLPAVGPVPRRFVSGAESQTSVRFVSRAWRNWVTAARRIEPVWTCECPRSVIDRATGQARPPRRHANGCTTRNLPLDDLSFFKGLELQRNGRAHLHVIVRVRSVEDLFVLQGRLRGLADRFGFGGKRRWRDHRGRLRSGFEIERPRSREAVARYVTKVAGSAFALAGEVAKVGQQRTLPPGARRASWSRGRRAWTTRWEDARRTDLEWSFVSWDPATLMRALEASGVVIDPHLAGVGYGGLPPWQRQRIPRTVSA